MRRALLLVVGLLVLGFGIYVLLALRADRGSDDLQIRGLLEAARAASEKSDVNGAMARVSRDYRDDNGTRYPALRLLVVQALRNGKPTVRMEVKSIAVNGDTALADLHVAASVERELKADWEGDVKLHLAREEAHRFWFFAVPEWRVVNIEGASPLNP